MELITKQVDGKPLTITIEYSELDMKIKKIIQRIKSLDLMISANSDGKTFSLNVSEIYYIETVGRKVFLYTEDEIYMVDKKLYELEKQLEDTGIIRISKFCLMNMDMLYSVKQLMNSQLEATLLNGEKLIVARTYLKCIKDILKEEVR